MYYMNFNITYNDEVNKVFSYIITINIPSTT